jgi:hypothetical protein
MADRLQSITVATGMPTVSDEHAKTIPQVSQVSSSVCRDTIPADHLQVPDQAAIFVLRAVASLSGQPLHGGFDLLTVELMRSPFLHSHG